MLFSHTASSRSLLRRPGVAIAALSLALIPLAGCGSDKKAADTTVVAVDAADTTAAPDTAATDTSAPDTAAPDTEGPADTAAADSAAPADTADVAADGVIAPHTSPG